MNPMREVPGGLDELGAARLVEGRTILVGLESEHRAADAEAFADAVADRGRGGEAGVLTVRTGLDWD